MKKNDRESYPYRLMAALSGALEFGAVADVDAIGMVFDVSFPETGRRLTVPYAYDDFMAYEYLQDLEILIVNLEFAAALEAELQATRERALAKLTDTERAALGL